MNLDERRLQHELATGQALRFMIPLSPTEIALGVFCMILLGLIVGYMAGLSVCEHLHPVKR